MDKSKINLVLININFFLHVLYIKDNAPQYQEEDMSCRTYIYIYIYPSMPPRAVPFLPLPPCGVYLTISMCRVTAPIRVTFFSV